MKNLSKAVLPVVIYGVTLIMLSTTSSTETYVRAAEESTPDQEAVTETFIAEVTAYTSSVGETDDTPFLTASGDSTGPGTIACPSRFKFGTLIQIEKRIFKCNDRMNKRYRDTNHFDIWLETKEEALKFGRKTLEVSVTLKDIHSLAEK